MPAVRPPHRARSQADHKRGQADRKLEAKLGSTLAALIRVADASLQHRVYWELRMQAVTGVRAISTLAPPALLKAAANSKRAMLLARQFAQALAQRHGPGYVADVLYGPEHLSEHLA